MQKSVYAAMALATLSGLASSACLAADSTAAPYIDQRLNNQEKRIQKGEQSGQLTPREAARLEKREAKIQGDLAKAKADGVVTNQERAKLNRELDRSSVAIARQKHDRQHDYDHDGKVDRRRSK